MKTKTLEIIDRMRKAATYWNDEEGWPMATLMRRRREEHWPLTSSEFADWLKTMVFELFDRILKREELEIVLYRLSETAREGPTYKTALRVGEHDETLYYDLADTTGTILRITDETIDHIYSNCPIRFRRPTGIRPLPMPEKCDGGPLLSMFLNLRSDQEQLLAAWLVGSLFPQGPFPILALKASPGSGKSSAARFIKALTDPHTVPLRSLPFNEREFGISARNSRILAWDNVTTLTRIQEDMLCRASTGAGTSSRLLYSNDGEVIFDLSHPDILTGVDLHLRPDLLDRAIYLQLPEISPEYRLSEAELRQRFETFWPRNLFAILSLFQTSYFNVQFVKRKRLPRMADFALRASAIEPALGLGPGGFVNLMDENREEAKQSAKPKKKNVEQSSFEGNDAYEDPTIEILLKFLQDRDFEGTATLLLEELRSLATNPITRMQLPKQPNILSNKLNKNASILHQHGFVLYHPPHGRERLLSITRTASTQAVQI